MKQVNENGFWRIENNPISQVGVFPYLGKNISDQLEPNKIYFVYRPASELFAPETLESFNSTPLPLVDEHEMLGDGATPAENKGIHGVISNVRQDGKLLVGDISIYSETMKDEINRGKKDLSMGYYCEYDLQEGEYDGQHYDAVQRNLRGNHVALVDQGRCGHSVRVYDHFSIEEQTAAQDADDQDTAREDGNNSLENNEGIMEAKDAQFEESKHPRADNGQFTSGSGGGGSSGGKSEIEKHVVIATQPKSSTNKNNSSQSSGTKTNKKDGDIPDSLVKRVVSGAKMRDEISNRFKENSTHPKEIKEIWKYSKDPQGLATSYWHLTTLKEMLKESCTKAHSWHYGDDDLKQILKGAQNAFNKVNELATSSARDDKSAKVLSKLKSTAEEFNSFLDKCIEKKRALRQKQGYSYSSDPEYFNNYKIKNTANDSGYIASLKGADSVSKEENKMAEELKARDGDLVIKHDDEEEVKDASVDKRELIREIGAIAGQAGMSEELVRTLMHKAEQLAYNGSEQSEATDACGKDEDAEMEEEFKETEDSNEEKDEEKISKLVEKKVEDALNGIDLLALVEAKKNMLEKVRPLVGDFDASKMTNNDIAKYACDKLNIKATSDSANDVLDCYLNMKGNTKIYSTADSMDDSADDIIARYKRGE